MTAKLGILAGGGDLPGRLIEACRDQGREVFIVAFDGFADHPAIKTVPHMWARLGALGTWLDRLKKEGATDLVMAGAVRRPSLADLRPDWRGMKFLTKTGALSLGDDGLLTAAIRELEKEGFRVVGVQDIIGGGLLAPAGALGAAMPDETALADLKRGFDVAKGLGALDVGQGVVVQQGIVLAVEAVEGTDAMLARSKVLRREGGGGVLVKVRKPNQEDRADLPTIGVTTVERAAEAGLAGIGVEAGQAIVVDRERTVARADALGLFVYGIEEGA